MNANNVLSINGWQTKLKQLENSQQWDAAIELMQSIIKTKPDDVDAYLAINFLMMNQLGYGEYDKARFANYAKLAKHYFDNSHEKFADNADYLFFMSMNGYFGEWYLGLEIEDLSHMRMQALKIDPNNILYKWACCSDEDKQLAYARQIMQKDSPCRKILEDKGSMGEYLLDIMEANIKKADKESLDECK